jgi:hypothetical protein
MLTNSNFVIKLGIKINCLDITSNFAIYMDNLNSNIIKNNNVSNYYKKIQNISIYDNISYKIINFKENVNNYDKYVNNIYSEQINKLYVYNEFDIGYNSFFNIMINTLNNYSFDVDFYVEELKIINGVYNTLLESLNKCVILLEYYFGGNNNDSIVINEKNKTHLFDIDNFKNENNQINMFTMIYKNFQNRNINNNIIVIMFYNICFIIWTTLGINILEESQLFLKIFYMLGNLINTDIVEFIELVEFDEFNELDKLTSTNTNTNTNNKKYSELNSFFDKMNVLLFNNYNNNELIDVVKIFFQDIIYNYIYGNVNNSESQNNINDIYDFNKNINSKQNTFKNNKKNKIINWQYLIGLSVDYNNSNYTQNIKSIINIYTDDKLQEQIFNYIFYINGGLNNNYGIVEIIENMQLLFDDELISSYSGNDYKIFLKNFQNINKQHLINEMLGITCSTNTSNPYNIITGIKPYIKIYNDKTFIIPIKFFFEKYFNSIPLISCMYSTISLSLNLKNKNIVKNTYDYINLTKCNVDSYLDLNYVIIERDERKFLSENKIDNLIEKTNNHSSVKNIINLCEYSRNKLYKNIKLNFDFDLENLVKELVWTFDLNVDNYVINIIKNFKINQSTIMEGLRGFQGFGARFGFNLDSCIESETNFDFIVNTKFLMGGMRRDGINSLDATNNANYNKITTLLNPYKYNTKALSYSNDNTYSFSLEPMEFQPTGAINMSNIDTFTIQVEININKLLYYLDSLNILFDLDKVSLSMGLTTYEYNLIRYQSGLAGLLFVK